MALQPASGDKIDHSTTPPFLLRLFYRSARPLDPYEFSQAPPPEATASTEYFSILPEPLQQSSLALYQWSDCTLAQLTRTLMTELNRQGEMEVGVGSRVVYKLIFPDTRAQVSENGRGKWIDKPLGSVVVGGREAELEDNEAFEGDSNKTLADARTGLEVEVEALEGLEDGEVREDMAEVDTEGGVAWVVLRRRLRTGEEGIGHQEAGTMEVEEVTMEAEAMVEATEEAEVGGIE
ncbi:hypothetical protein B0A48_09940 [Cryoendolithus antarcticus]|uniref:Uncharacterized protein n=1 Tax=Cryoendolithus antarcticus TaxID=1507870 RepID=A0A1V8T357_9PEZI|nr:hypothetical protein B0A48_09940 [Cryoendolithus antarcticus]